MAKESTSGLGVILFDISSFADSKSSPVTWLESVPKHWSMTQGQAVFKMVPDKNTGLQEPTVLTLSYGRVLIKDPEKMHGLVPASLAGYQVLIPGDIVIRPTDLQNDQTSLRVGIVRNRGIITSAYLGFRVNPAFDPEYIFQYLAVLDSEKVFYGMGTGLRQNLEWDDFKHLPILVPPLDEQRAIVKYLGHAHARINAAIAQKRKLIALLEEERQAIINQAVTRGLDPHVKLKDSGVPWLGQVPTEWEVSALRYHYHQELGKMLDSKTITGTSLVSYLRNTDVQWKGINVHDLPKMDISAEEYDRYTLSPGDLVVCEGGEIGRAAIWRGNKVVGYQKALHRLRPRDPSRDMPEFLLLVLRAATQLNAFDDGHVSTIPHLTGDKVRAQPFAWPPLPEQQAIVAYIDGRTASIDKAVAHMRREIELLTEFKTRLTSDVVTGQVDVRAVAATLPDLTEAEAAETDDEPEEDEVSDEELDDIT